MSIFDVFAKLEQEKAAKQADAGPIEWLVVGLGNPGSKYAETRHNAGFRALDAYCAKSGQKMDKMKFKSLIGEGQFGGARVLFMKPQTFMNLSGEAVRDAAAFYKLDPSHILVLSDDISLDVGRIRVRAKGSAGGQNGLKNIIYHLNSDQFPRVKIGVGANPIQATISRTGYSPGLQQTSRKPSTRQLHAPCRRLKQSSSAARPKLHKNSTAKHKKHKKPEYCLC